MGFFDFFSSKPKYSEREIMAKGMAGVAAYQRRNFRDAAHFFAEYFDMKGVGNYPTLDQDDFQMKMNLMMSNFYIGNYRSSADTCTDIINNLSPTGDTYAFLALSQYKLGNHTEANKNWDIAKRRNRGCLKVPCL